MYRVILIACLVVLLVASDTTANDYLDHERLELPVNGTPVTTTHPLVPYHRYLVKISSPFDLRVFRTEVFRWFQSNDVYWDLFDFDGAEFFHVDTKEGLQGLINHVVFEVQGTGQPLRIQTKKDFTAAFDAPTLSVLVTRSLWWRREDGPGVRPALLVCAALLIIIVCIVCRSVHTRPAPAPLPVPVAPLVPRAVQEPPRPVRRPTLALPAPPRYQRFRLTPRQPCISPNPLPKDTPFLLTIKGLWVASTRGTHYDPAHDPTCYGVDAQYAGMCTKPLGAWQSHHRLFFDDAAIPAVAFQEDRHHHRFSFVYVGTGDKLVLFLEVPDACVSYEFWQQRSMAVTVRSMSAAERAALRPQAAATGGSAAAEKRQSSLDRLHALQTEYSGRSHLDDDTWIEQYTTKHLDELLRDRTRITTAYRALHADPDFIGLFKETAPALYTRVTWEYRALCRAEALEPGHPRRPKLTAEERQAKFARYRQRALERDRVQAEDRMAAVRQKLDLLRQYKDDLDAYDLDDDDRERLIQEFEDDVFTPTEEHADGTTFKQL